MLKVLIKKQLSEVFKTYFYDAKKNRMRSKGAIIGWFIFFFVIMVGMLGGMFTFLSLTLCDPLAQADMGWLYFLLLSGLAIFFGAFGSVFNTYAGLYMAKDNDLLLSLPIPVRTIITARLANVFLMGAMYSSVVMLPCLIVSWIVMGATVSRVLCSLILFLIITGIVLLLSCLLGWVVAKISLKLKNKSFITVLIALVLIGAYYFFYFKANDLIRDMIQNAAVYGEKIRGAAYGLYLFGRIGEGAWGPAALFLAVTALLFVLAWTVLTRSFLSIATSGGKTEKIRYVEKKARQKSVFRALLGKEFSRFTSSANYMLNCGLGLLLVPACGVLLLFMGKELSRTLGSVFTACPDSAAVLFSAMICLVSSMVDISAPSVSLEGKSLWIPQSLPVTPGQVLRAKMAVQLIPAETVVIFAALCAALSVEASPLIRILVFLTPVIYTAFSALYGTVIGVRMPLLSWTDETAPIKQSGAVTLVLFSSWGFAIILGGLYLLIGSKLGAALYLGLWAAVYAAAALLLLGWLDRKGSRLFAEL